MEFVVKSKVRATPPTYCVCHCVIRRSMTTLKDRGVHKEIHQLDVSTPLTSAAGQ